MKKEMILDDLKNCGLSQYFNKKGLCSVFDNDDGTFNLVISTGRSLRNGEVIETHNSVTLDDIERITG